MMHRSTSVGFLAVAAAGAMTYAGHVDDAL